MDNKRLIQESMEALKRFAALPPEEQRRRLVAKGIINEQGEYLWNLEYARQLEAARDTIHANARAALAYLQQLPIEELTNLLLQCELVNEWGELQWCRFHLQPPAEAPAAPTPDSNGPGPDRTADQSGATLDRGTPTA